jgi:regulatory factor X
MSLNHDHALQKLAANVRVATTTSASDRAKQIFVQAWLTANYAPYPDGNVPRQGLYFSYRRVCDQYQIPHINTATLGKAIRLCFPTIKTRRLGVRGNSKYHYCGIRPATSAEAEFLQDYIRKSNNNAGQSSINAARAAQESGETNKGEERSDDDDDEDSEGSSASKGNTLVLSGDIKGTVTYGDLSDKTPTAGSLLSQAQAVARNSTYPSHAPIRRHASQPESNIPPQPTLSLGPSTNGQYVQPHQHLSVRHMPHFPSIEEAVGSGSASAQSIAGREAWGWFQDHLDAVLESTRSFRFDQFEMHLRGFWSTLTGAHREIVHAPAIAGLMAKADAIVYDEILEFLRSQMLSPLPAASLNNLRQLASQMEKILLLALDGYGTTFMEPKVELGARFGHLVLRFLDIYQVTQALNTVLTNQKQLAEMRRSWQKVDFESVRNQSALVCNCRHEDLVQLLEVEFVAMMDGLAKSNEPVRDVMAWADKCTERLMEQRIGTSDDRGAMSPRSVLIRWGYVTSQVMRDLTIRSDPAFGAFQIMKLFLDDWIAVNVLRNVALSTNSVAASVEPVIQQQFFSLSPMAGQESFNTIEARPQHAMNHTPTTSSMLAALQHDPFPPGALDASASGFNSDAYGGLNYMDTAVTPEESIPSVHQAGLSFSEYATTNTFDVASFSTQELSLSGNSSEPERELESIKAEAAS